MIHRFGFFFLFYGLYTDEAIERKSSVPMLPVLVINLPDAEARMKAFMQRMSYTLLSMVTVERVDAIDGRHGRLRLEDVDVTPRIRYGIQNRLDIADKESLPCMEAVANFLSHRACWKRIVDSKWPAAIVMEDDACPDPQMEEWLEQNIAWLTTNAAEWDFVMLGFEIFPFGSASKCMKAATLGGATVYRPLQWAHKHIFGSHCYLVSQNGADALLKHGKPMELHADMFLLMCSSIGLVNGFFADYRSMCWQCNLEHNHRGWFDVDTIPHLDWTKVNVKMLIPNMSIRCACIVLLTAISAGYILNRGGSNAISARTRNVGPLKYTLHQPCGALYHFHATAAEIEKASCQGSVLVETGQILLLWKPALLPKNNCVSISTGMQRAFSSAEIRVAQQSECETHLRNGSITGGMGMFHHGLDCSAGNRAACIPK